MLLTCIIACLRNSNPYHLCDINVHLISDVEGRATVAQRYQETPI